MTEFDVSCVCGWPLPQAVLPMRVGRSALGEDDIVPGAMVTLVCPLCCRGHSFIQPHEAVNLEDARLREKLGILPKGTRRS